MELELPATKVIYKLPEILDTSEVQAIIKAAVGNIMHKTLLMVTYSAGLRVSEVVRLKPVDICHKRMTLHIRDTKNGMDRYVILSPIVLEQLVVCIEKKILYIVAGRLYWVSSCKIELLY